MVVTTILYGITLGSGLVTILGALLTFFGLMFRNSIMQLVGGAIIIYALAIWKVLPGWMIALLVVLFLFLLLKDKK